MSELNDLFVKYGTDKAIAPWGWGYTPAYVQYLDRERIKNVLEIGICGYRDIPGNVVGASLKAWRDYLPNAQVYGVDNDGRFIFSDDRITTALCDAYAGEGLSDELHKWGKYFDFICDDAVHDPFPQIHLARKLWPWLTPGGIYAIEEACPYKFPGGTLEPMIDVFYDLLPGVAIVEYKIAKPERLLLLRKNI